jgi:hypothetical protein
MVIVGNGVAQDDLGGAVAGGREFERNEAGLALS